MPASMIMADTGGIWKVIGMRSAIVLAEPIPGKTPTSVPSRTPVKQLRRLKGVRHTEKPRIIESSYPPS